MDALQYYLTKLAEEAAEVGQIALKAQQFGPQEVMPGQPLNNFERCHLELDDLHAMVEELNEKFGFGYTPNRERIEAKKQKVEKFLGYSTRLGMVKKKNLSLVFEAPLSDATKSLLEMTDWIAASWGHALHERDMALSEKAAKEDEEEGRYLTLVFEDPIPGAAQAALEQSSWTAASWSHATLERDKAFATAGMMPHGRCVELTGGMEKVAKIATLRVFEKSCPW